VNHPSKLKLIIGQMNKLKSFIKNTGNKKEYRRLLAILQKGESRTYEGITNEHGVSTRSVQRWVAAYIQSGIDGVKMNKPGGKNLA
jgi:transposase